MAPRPKNISNEERNRVVQFILQLSQNGKPKYGRLLEAQRHFGLSKSTVHRLWKEASTQQKEGLVINIISKKPGRERENKMKPDYDKIKSLPLTSRSSLRKMEVELKVSKTTLGKWAKLGLLRAHTSALKPSLTADNKFIRLRFSLEQLELDRVMNGLRFSSMHNILHIDEKWFYITKGSNRYYLAPDEVEAYRSCKSKKFIGKIMFLCAVIRPLLRSDGSVEFDGKIGIFSFTHQVEAKRKSKHRDRGTFETKAVDSITRDVIKGCVINKVLLAIREKWPPNRSKVIYIQQDNVKPHIVDTDIDFREHATKHGFNITLIQQPPNSPDTNINDLGFFNAIQALQQQRTCKTVDDLVNAVVTAFYELSPSTLNKVFLTLQGCLTEIMKAQGHNSYKIPHMAKDRMIRAETLSVSLQVPLELARDSVQYLVEHGQIRGIEQLIGRLGLEHLTGVQASRSLLIEGSNMDSNT